MNGKRVETLIFITIFIVSLSNIHCLECDLDQHICNCGECCVSGENCLNGCPNSPCSQSQPICCDPVCTSSQHLCECGSCCSAGDISCVNGCPNVACKRRQPICCNNISSVCGCSTKISKKCSCQS